MDIKNIAEKEYEQMVEQRRHMHMNPELSFQEKETVQYILKNLEPLEHFNVKTVADGRGIKAVIQNKSGSVVAFRADFDALPINDEKDVPYRSQVPGVMHACGHDAHTSVLLAVARVLNEQYDALEGTVVLIFQFAEELAPGGAKFMVEDGVMEGVDRVYGNHFMSPLEVGTVYCREGAMMACPDLVEITIQGKGGHGAKPHTSSDAVVAAAYFITSIQSIINRNINPVDSAVITIGTVEAGSNFNVIADRATLSATIRTYKQETREIVRSTLKQELEGLSRSKNITYDYKYTEGYPAVVNEHETYELVKRAAARAGIPYEETLPLMIGEDFAYYQQEAPGTFFLTAAGNKQEGITAAHHHPLFDIDESSMKQALQMFISILQEEGMLVD